MLCTLCSHFRIEGLLEEHRRCKAKGKLMLGRETYYEHHPHHTHLSSSASAGCSLCKYIYQCLTKQVDLESAAASSYRYEMHYGNPQIYFGCREQPPQGGVPEIVVSQQTNFGTFRTIAQFEVFTKGATSSSPGLVHRDLGISFAREVAKDPCSPPSLSRAKAFLETCASDHGSCAKPRYDLPLPTRVLDVGPADGSQDARLVLSEGGVGGWVALSYRWGEKSDFILSEATIGDFQRRIHLDQMPKTLRDAVVVTRALDIQYLWVDALCIRQDSPEDWAREASKMCGVYRNALVTIVAACATSTESGFLGPRICTEWPLVTNDDGILKDHELFLRPSSFYAENPFTNSILRTRGWVLQETILSPRILAYTEKEMVWQCSEYVQECGRRSPSGLSFMGMPPVALLLRQRIRQKHRWTDTAPKFPQEHSDRHRQIEAAGPRRLGGSKWGKTLDYRILRPSVRAKEKYFRNNKALSKKLYSGWLDIVQEYTSRKLTNPSDVLSALAGVAEEFPCKKNDEYCAGLWRSQLIPGLYWCREDVKGGYNSVQTDLEGCLSQIPSWSWASIQGPPATFLSRKDMYLPGSIKDVCMVSRWGGNVFSDLKSGHIRIAAPFITIEDFRPDEQLDAVVRALFAHTVLDDLNPHDTVTSLQGRLINRDNPAPESTSHCPSVSQTKWRQRGYKTRQTPSIATYPELHSWIRSQWKANPAFRSEFNQKHTSCDGQEFAILMIGKHTLPKFTALRVRKHFPLPPRKNLGGHFLLLVLESAQPRSQHDPHKFFRRVGILQLDLTSHFGGIWMDIRNRDLKLSESRHARRLAAETEKKADAERQAEIQRIRTAENGFHDELDRLVKLRQEIVLV